MIIDVIRPSTENQMSSVCVCVCVYVFVYVCVCDVGDNIFHVVR